MKSHYRVAVIGGGVVGASVAYHLTKFGWTDVAILERNVLTAGSSWHAAGGIHALNADPNMAALQAYTIDLLSEVEQESGIDIGLHMTGGITFACADARWEWLQAAYRTFQTIGIEDCHLMTPDEIKEKCPILSTEGIIGGLWADREGYIDTTGTVHAYARAAKNRGADIIEHNRVLELNWKGSEWEVITEKGTITAEHVVNAGGLWAKQCGRMVGLDLPVSPLAHHYFLTETIPQLETLDFEVPMTVDLEGFTYMRQDKKGILVGIYETNHQHWMMDGAPWEYGIELLQEDTDRIENELMMAFDRYPCLNDVGISSWVNGAFTFSPDGNPLVGPVESVPNYWLACGVMAGFLQGGGVGKTLAEWMIHGDTETDAWSMDIARYGPQHSNKEYIKQTTGQFYSRRFVMTYPNEQLPAGRPLKMAPAHDAMAAAGARWGESWGLEVPLYFAPKDFVETPSLNRSDAEAFVKAECEAVRNQVGLLDITGFSRFEVYGPGAEAWLDRMFSTKLPKPGRARLAVMLSPQGKLKGDLTLFNWGDGKYWIMGSYYLRQWHKRWFHDHEGENMILRDVSDDICGFSLSGPNSTKVMQALQPDFQLPFMGCGEVDLGLLRCKVGRLSVTGELGYEIHCRANEHIALRRILLEAGADHGIKDIGFNAMLSLRIEKSFGIWSAEFTQDRTAAMTGMDRWIDWQKPDFHGREAAMTERDAGPSEVLVTLGLDSPDADCSGYEPVWSDGKRVGFTTSGAYGYTVGQSIAMAMVDPAFAEPGTELSVHVVGKERSAKVLTPSPYDPEGKAMRG